MERTEICDFSQLFRQHRQLLQVSCRIALNFDQILCQKSEFIFLCRKSEVQKMEMKTQNKCDTAFCRNCLGFFFFLDRCAPRRMGTPRWVSCPETTSKHQKSEDHWIFSMLPARLIEFCVLVCLFFKNARLY